MATPLSRTQLKAYCLRELGDPVIKINVSDDQLEDRIDEALQLFLDWHQDATVRTYVKHQVTQENLDTRIINVSDKIVHITNLLAVSGFGGGNSSVLNDEYQYQLSAYMTLRDVMGSGLLDYTLMMQKMSAISSIMNPDKIIEFVRHANQVYISANLREVAVGDYLVFDCYIAVDNNTYPDVWNNYWLKKYTTQLFKKQWGSNLSKFDNIQLLSGVTYNGQKLYQEAIDTLALLTEELETRYSQQIQGVFVG
jgi:hypothetical protein